MNELAKEIAGVNESKGFFTPDAFHDSIYDQETTRADLFISRIAREIVSLGYRLEEIRKAKDLKTPCPITEREALLGKLCLIVTEVGEAIEAVLDYKEAPAFVAESSDEDYQLAFDNLKEELADIHIRVFHIEAGLGIEPDETIRRKLNYNKTRPYRHGKQSGT